MGDDNAPTISGGGFDGFVWRRVEDGAEVESWDHAESTGGYMFELVSVSGRWEWVRVHILRRRPRGVWTAEEIPPTARAIPIPDDSEEG